MNSQNIIIPTKEAVINLITHIMKSDLRMQRIGELHGMKMIDDLTLPMIEGGPEWDYKGLEIFLKEHSIAYEDTLEDALNKLK